MIQIDLPVLGRAKAWRAAARRLASHGIAPEEVDWQGGTLFGSDPMPAADGPRDLRVPKSFVQLSGSVICHTDPEAPALLYQALWRHQDDRRSLGNPADPLTRRLDRLAKPVGRDIHKMHAFVRFRELPTDGARRRFAAWFEPDHRIVEAAAPFFARRFADMDWLIATPFGTARFSDGQLDFDLPGPRPDLPEDASEALWTTYFTNIFNPARVKIGAMKSEMPVKYWKNLPETRAIPAMLQDAEARVQRMRDALPTEPPKRAARIAAMPATLDQARAAAETCSRCDLCAPRRMVWGEGPTDAPLMIVGEAPGDHEDQQAQPFVGPAGQLLRAAMAEAGCPPAYLTNAVKHFKIRQRGKQRLHQSPTRGEIDHCRWWLDQERRLIRPRLTVALGASAAFALTGRRAALTSRRGTLEPAIRGGDVLITWHPAAILRARSRGAEMRAELAADLNRAVGLAKERMGAQGVRGATSL